MEAHQDLQEGTPWMKERMTIWEDWCFKQRREKSSQGKDPKTFEGNSQGRDPSTQERNSQGDDPRTSKDPVGRSLEDRSKVGTSVLAKYTARERTREPLKHQLKGGGFRKSGKERSGRGRRRKRRKHQAQKKPLVDKAQRTIGGPLCVGKRRRTCGRKRQEEEQESQRETISGKIWKMALPSLDFDAELVLCRCCSREADAKRGSGSAGNHCRVGCGGRHFREPGWVESFKRSKRKSTTESGSGQQELVGLK